MVEAAVMIGTAMVVGKTRVENDLCRAAAEKLAQESRGQLISQWVVELHNEYLSAYIRTGLAGREGRPRPAMADDAVS